MVDVISAYIRPDVVAAGVENAVNLAAPLVRAPTFSTVALPEYDIFCALCTDAVGDVVSKASTAFPDPDKATLHGPVASPFAGIWYEKLPESEALYVGV
ncbi:hypothetical protein AS149_14210 [Burkholderia cenocepacia]|nr:hypothetical protein AS149_14210 [Burkholderia cenocepacia]